MNRTLFSAILFLSIISNSRSAVLDYSITTTIGNEVKQGLIYFQGKEEFKDKPYYIRHDNPQLYVDGHDYPLVFNPLDYSQEWLSLSVCTKLGLNSSGGGFMGEGLLKNPNRLVAYISLNKESKNLYNAKIIKLSETKFVKGTGSIDMLWCGDNRNRSSNLEGHPEY